MHGIDLSKYVWREENTIDFMPYVQFIMNLVASVFLHFGINPEGNTIWALPYYIVILVLVLTPIWGPFAGVAAIRKIKNSY